MLSKLKYSFRKPALRPLELVLLNELKNRLPSKESRLFEAQIRLINSTRRLQNCTEINFYMLKHGKQYLDNNLKFDFDSNEVEIAKAKCNIGSSSFKVSYWIINNRIFSLTFDVSPKSYLDHNIISINSFNLLLENTIGEKAVGYTLPSDYNEYLKKMPMQKLCIYSMDKIRKIVLASVNYYILGEIVNDGYLLLEENDQTGEILLIHHDDDRTVKLGNTIEKAISYIDRHPVL